MSQSVVPDLFEPITAYREWNVHGQSPVLWSLVLSKQWPVHEPLLAEGRLDVGGIYAFNDTSELLGFGNIQGEVWLWGRVEEHEHGYRAQYAYPKRLWAATRHVPGLPRVSTEHMQAVGEHYGVPILHSRKERFPWKLADIVARFRSSLSTPLSPPRWSSHPPYVARPIRQSPWP